MGCRLLAVSLFFSTTLYFNPKRLVPGFVKDVSWTNSLAASPGAVLHMFALKVSQSVTGHGMPCRRSVMPRVADGRWTLCVCGQGIGMSVVAGLAAVGYDAKHKAMLNSALLIYHLSVLVGLTSAACLGPCC